MLFFAEIHIIVHWENQSATEQLLLLFLVLLECGKSAEVRLVSIVMGVPLDRWMVYFREKPNLKWMMLWGTPMTFMETPRGVSIAIDLSSFPWSW